MLHKLGEKRCIQSFGAEVVDVDERLILKQIFKKWDEGMDWIDQAQDRDRWWDLLNSVMSLRVP